MRRARAHRVLALLALTATSAPAAGSHRFGFGTRADDGSPGPTAAELLGVLDGLAQSPVPVCQLAAEALLTGLSWDGRPLEEGSASAWTTALQRRVRRQDAVALLASRLGAPAACVRRLAATLLGRSDSPEALARLRLSLTAAAPAEREAAALGLGERADAASLASLQQALGDADAGVAAAAAWALGETGDARALAALLQASRHAQPRVRKAAVASLAQLDGAEAATVQQALRVALSDVSPDVRREAALALGR